MNKLILCEGVTDAILLSYYLEKTFGWKYCKAPKDIAIKENDINESVNWYSSEHGKLLICGVGGKDNFKNFFEKRVKAPILNVNAFDTIVVITDRDDKEIPDIEKRMNSAFKSVISDFKDREWSDNTYSDLFGIEHSIRSLLIVIPSDHQGALETVMLDAVSESKYDANIVNKVKDFVHFMRDEASRYICSDRLELKAQLGVTWAIQFPEKIFKLINEQIRSVPWEKSKVLHECFAMLGEI